MEFSLNLSLKTSVCPGSLEKEETICQRMCILSEMYQEGVASRTQRWAKVIEKYGHELRRN